LKKKFDRSKIKKGVIESQNRSNRTKDSKGVSGAYSYDIEASGLPQYKPISNKDKPNQVFFLPFFPGDNDPTQGKLPESEREWTHILDYWDHNLKGVGRFVCLLNSYGKKCPVCEYIKANRLEKEEWMALRPMRRGVYAVWDLADKEAGPKIWYTPFNSIELKAQKAAKDLETGEIVYYTDIDEGSNLYFTFEDKGNYNYEYDNFQFKARKKPIPDEILESVPSLDEFLVIPSYDDVRLAFDPHGTTLAEEELDNIKKSYDDDEDEEEVKTKPAKKVKLECPEDGTFGEDFNELPECEECDLFDKCGDKYEELHPEKEEEPEEEPEPEPEKPKTERKPLRRRG
jgi:hypothetical protein